MYFDLHRSANNAISQTIFTAEEGNEHLVVIVGNVRVRKIMAFQVILGSLEQEMYRLAFVPNPDISFIQLPKETIGQLSGEVPVEIAGHRSLKCLTNFCLRQMRKARRS
jgi:hypothetical protein